MSAQYKYLTEKYVIWFGVYDARFFIPEKFDYSKLKGVYKPRVFFVRLRLFLFFCMIRMNLGFLFSRGIVVSPKGFSASSIGRISNHLGVKKNQFLVFTGTVCEFRKITVQMELSSGAYVFVKVPVDQKSHGNIRKEHDALTFLTNVKPKTFLCPAVVYDDGSILVQSSFDIVSMKDAGMSLTEKHIRLLNELSLITRKKITFRSSEVYRNIMEKQRFFPVNLKDSVLKVIKKAEKKRFDFYVSHGDFAPWNMKMIHQDLFVFDWEYFKEARLPFFDLFHFVVQTAILVEHKKSDAIFNEVLLACKAKDLIGDFLEKEICFFFLIYLLDVYLKTKRDVVFLKNNVQSKWLNKTRIALMKLCIITINHQNELEK